MRVAITAIAVGTTLGAVAAWNPVHLLEFDTARVPLHDAYIVIGSPSLTVYFFLLGFIGNMMFRSRAIGSGRMASAVSLGHLLVTSALLLAAFLMRAVGVTAQRAMTLSAIDPLLLATHGLALAAGGVILLGRKPSAALPSAPPEE